jgi:hypothetical protein
MSVTNPTLKPDVEADVVVLDELAPPLALLLVLLELLLLLPHAASTKATATAETTAPMRPTPLTTFSFQR